MPGSVLARVVVDPEALAALLASGSASARLPEPNHVFYGTALRNGVRGINGAPYLNPFGEQSAAGLAYLKANTVYSS